MAGATSLVALHSAVSSQLDLSNPASWVPPLPQEGVFAALSQDAAAAAAIEAEAGQIPPGLAPPLPPIVPPTVNVVTDNAFGRDPFDANGCPILSPTDLQALATLPFREFRAVEGATDTLPPLPEGFDVMPLAQSNGIFVETEDFFRFRAISTSDNVPVSFFGRVQRPSGYIIPFNHTLRTATANTTFTTTPVPGKGILLGAAASVPIGSITNGAVNAVGEIGRIAGGTFTPHTLLFSGQLDDLYPLTIDGGGLPPTEGRPTILTVDSNPAVATPKLVTITPSAGKRIRFLRLTTGVATSAVAQTRFVGASIVKSGLTAWSAFYGGFLTASCAAICEGAMGGSSARTDLSPNAVTHMNLPLPESMYFYEAVTVSFDIYLPAAGDVLQNARIRYEES